MPTKVSTDEPKRVYCSRGTGGKNGSGSDFTTVTVDMLAVERERAKKRQSAGGGDEPGKETFPDPDVGQARDKAAEKVNADVSGVRERGSGKNTSGGNFNTALTEPSFGELCYTCSRICYTALLVRTGDLQNLCSNIR